MVTCVAWRPVVGVTTLKVNLGCCWTQCSEALGVRHPLTATHCPHYSRWGSASVAQSGHRSSCGGHWCTCTRTASTAQAQFWVIFLLS